MAEHIPTTKEQTMVFGVAGIPHVTEQPSYIHGLQKIAELGLQAFELPFVQFVNMSEATARQFRQEKEALEQQYQRPMFISVHAPYFINLNAAEEQKVSQSIERIIKAAQRGALAGATTIVFHPGFYLKDPPEEAYGHVKEAMLRMLAQYYDLPGEHPMLRPETTGKPIQFGTVAELVKLASEIKDILPCIDFAHLHARTNGLNNTEDELNEILSLVEDGLGREQGLEQLHIHYSGIEYTQKGERRHLPLQESDIEYTSFLKVLRDRDCAGRVICESPALEQDALLLQETYRAL